MNLEKLKETWRYEERYSFKGWDFSHINNRMEEETLPWDYKKLVKSYISEEKILLDMGTGGGEFLLSLNPTEGKTYATESYLPNIELCKSVLTSYGIDVRPVSDDSNLPFDDRYFDIIINRHESFCVTEINRILKPGGIFITQQVGGMNNREISKFLLGEYPNITDIDLNLDKILLEAKAIGMRIIDTGECFPKTYFYDIGAFVFYAKIIEWEFPGFSVERCFNKLVELQAKLEKQGYIETLEHRYFLIAEKQ
ncbi:class I SAM-dependent methyltransferase [Tissierella sp. MB52-C2]|uniref:class I SAM-dependent methyltransferase n=1 Tax=Tissierella sp. MB52-C2 TaxID=3070999 RepID=UPI00280BBB22|nr:class I SAM-dependent methyltransferase [Tissierella sp. MB52-C2]WMM25505.1 class I SAM-dependent methyltransferase [Tissierella sp. MB52-C2]